LEETITTKSAPFEDLVSLIERLRGQDGCPWDRKQSPDEVGVYLIEEVYELVEAIKEDSAEEICNELGDVLFQVVFLARLYEEMGAFDIGDVISHVVHKMIQRHPHVFGNAQVRDSEEVKSNWFKMKLSAAERSGKKSVFDSIPKGLPALMQAYRILERAARMGLLKLTPGGLLGNIDSKLEMFKKELKGGKKANDAVKLCGDLLLALTKLSVAIQVHPELALLRSTEEMIKKLESVEKNLRKKYLDHDSTGEEK